MATCDLSDPQILEVYEKVKGSAPENWLLLGYGDTRNKLSVTAFGSGGVAELQSKLEGPVSFAYVKHGAADYVIVLYVDPSTATSLQKAKSSVHKRAVAGHLVYHHAILAIESKDDLTAASLDKAISTTDLPKPEGDPRSGGSKASTSGSSAAIAAEGDADSVSARLAARRLARQQAKDGSSANLSENSSAVSSDDEKSKADKAKQEAEEKAKKAAEAEAAEKAKKEAEAAEKAKKEAEAAEKAKQEAAEKAKQEAAEKAKKEAEAAEKAKQEAAEKAKQEEEEEAAAAILQEEKEAAAAILQEEKEAAAKSKAKADAEANAKAEAAKAKAEQEAEAKAKEEAEAKAKAESAAKAKAESAAASASEESLAKKSGNDEDIDLEGLTEEELAALMEDLGVDNQPSIVKADPRLVASGAVVVHDEKAKEEEKIVQTELIEKIITQLETNDPYCVRINLNNSEFFTEEQQLRLGAGLAKNEHIIEFAAANAKIGERAGAAIAKGLTLNKSIGIVNLESNLLGGPGLEALADLLLVNTTIKELLINNQRTAIPSKAETKLANAIEKNTSLQKLGYVCRDQACRQKIDKFIFRNKDLARQARVAASKKK